MRLLIRNGTLVTATSRAVADVLVTGSRIEAVGPSLPAGALDVVVEAGHKLVLPGGIDAHTHLDMPLSASLTTADDFESGTVAAACGGTTTILDYATQTPGRPLREAVDEWMRRAEGRAAIDYGFHAAICDLRPEVEGELDSLVRAGVTSFKVFMAYPGRLMLEDEAILRVLQHGASSGGLVCVHAEDGRTIERLVAEALAAGNAAPRYHALTRPASTEADAIRRAVSLAERAGARLYVVHLSSGAGVEAVREGQRRGVHVFAETCPQYLFLSDEVYDANVAEASKYVMSPPLRPRQSQEALWSALAAGEIHAVATDHCPFRLQDKLAASDFSRIPNGAPGIEPRLLLVYQGVCEGRLSVERFVDVTSTTPARLFGLFPAKGAIAPGSDADLVILDPRGKTVVSAATHHMRVDYNLYEGQELRGAVDLVLSRGEVIVEDREFVGSRGRGRFLPRHPAV